MATPNPAPTMPFPPRKPSDRSARCMLPPRPPRHPVALPYSSAMMPRVDIPLAIA